MIMNTACMHACTSVHWYGIDQGFPTQINRGPHTCQSGLKVGRMKQNYESFIDFSKEFLLYDPLY